MSQYASLNDVNVFLPQDKLPMDSSEIEPFALDSERIIRGYVGGVIPYATYNAWADPDSTPELIRAIAGRLIASAFYAERYSEDDPNVPAYAQSLYNVAIGYLMGIKAGTQVVIEADGTTIDVSSSQLTNKDFLPNDLSTPAAFTRDLIF
jgi:hypothetical protein